MRDGVVVSCGILRTTEKAVLCEFYDPKDGAFEKWVPRSVIEDGDQLEEGLNQDIEVAGWFATKEGIE
jgi:hypothetical protein